MKKVLLHFLAFVLSLPLLAHGDEEMNVYYVKDNKRTMDPVVQQVWREGLAWQNFLAANGDWYVHFNEETGMPHRAFGNPLAVPFMGDYEATARFFIDTKLSEYQLDQQNLEFIGHRENESFHYVDFVQKKGAAEVLDSRVTVQFNKENEVVKFGIDYHHHIQVDMSPTLTIAQVEARAENGIHNITSVYTDLETKILPITDNERYTYHLIYEVTVNAMSHEGIPQEFKTYVDAHSGDILYRRNMVAHINVNGDVKLDNPLGVDVNKGMPYIRMTAGGTTYEADSIGDIDFVVTSPTSATFRLQSDWVNVLNGGVTPTHTTTLAVGTDSFDITPHFIPEERMVFYHTNIIHDVMKGFLPNFNSLDVSLAANVELTSGTCNAFYNGSSINFYTQAGGCYSLAMVADVVYHEYGHGITNRFYNENGSSFNNGAMGEGYSDIWAIYITENPIVGLNYQVGTPGTYIRRYDMNPKVFPQDIVGQVHADGEIIAGAWYDAGLYLNDFDYMMYLNAQGMYGLPNGPDGAEGIVYTDILVEALLTDDAPANGGDNDITNGTPNDQDIVNGFADHGITLLSNATLNHNEIQSASSNSTLSIDATVSLQFAWALNGANVYYDINNTGSYTTVAMTNPSGNQYTADIPNVNNGDIVAYYLALEDNNGILTNVTPIGSNLANNANIPYYITVDFYRQHIEDFDNTQGAWLQGVPGDNATTGLWTIDLPVPSLSDPANPNSFVQPGIQNTPGGQICAITGNASSPSDGIGTNDVDGGKTTLQSPPFDLTGYQDPVITYARWYINNPPTGANPNADWWQVRISNDGTNWVYVENTKFSDASWRRNVLRVSDFVTPSATVQLQFIASDSLRPGQDLDGGSLIEAAVDDLEIMEVSSIGLEDKTVTYFNAYPNPAADRITLDFDLSINSEVEVSIYDASGRIVLSEKYNAEEGNTKRVLDVSQLQIGTYFLEMKTDQNIHVDQIQIQR